MFVKVAVEKISHNVDELYDYAVPNEYKNVIGVGKCVVVPFGIGNCPKLGIVIELSSENRKVEKLKEIMAVWNEVPPLSREEITLIKWMKKHYFCSYFEAAKLILPPGIKLNLSCIKYSVKCEKDISVLGDEKILWDRILDSEKNVITLKDIISWKIKNYTSMIKLLLFHGLIEKETVNIDFYDKKMIKGVKLCKEGLKKINNFTLKQSKVIEYLQKEESVSVKQLCYYTGIGKSVINTLMNKGVLSNFDVPQTEIQLSNVSDCERSYKKPILNEEQRDIFEKLFRLYSEKKFEMSLLHGVTGSGKTEILLELTDRVISDGKSVIFMVPEIALTAQFIESFRERYKDKTALLHSSLSNKERFTVWNKIKSGKISVILGTRSAVFAPVSNLGLVIIDEEHEFTYKSDSSPRFNAKDVAKYRCSLNKAQLILSSATPSLESYYNAKVGKYELFSINKRYGDAVLPSVEIVDMNGQAVNFGTNQFSQELVAALKENLNCKKQSLIFLNRRGYSPFAKCSCCSKVILCPNCSVSLNYHKVNGRLMCHYCGYSREFSSKCLECGSEKICCFGAGTQKAEDCLKELIPGVRILRMDSDSKNLKNSYKCELKKFANGDYDILLGTQMISKGFNFPNVTLVGVLSADQYMYTGDFRSYEKTFSLLTQVIGRAGRGCSPGKAIIQTFSPESDLLKLCANQDYEAFFENETVIRKAMLYPPFADICVIGFVSKTESKVHDSSFKFFKIIKNEASNKYKNIPLRIFAPCAANVKKVAGNYRYRIIIKCRNNNDFLNLISDSLRSFSKEPVSRDVRVFVDINPDSIL